LFLAFPSFVVERTEINLSRRLRRRSSAVTDVNYAWLSQSLEYTPYKRCDSRRGQAIPTSLEEVSGLV
jgi:hypothetical protein